jgi:hypothetical protein
VTVVSGGRTIFCEGKSDSLDYRLINKIVADISGDRCTIIPAGGKFTFSSFVQGYFSRNEMSNQRYIVFRDRDFDAIPTSDIQLLKLETRLGNNFTYLTYRSCIENYLLDAELISSYWTEKYQEKVDNPSSKWGHGKPPDQQTIWKWIETSARTILSYQAVRWALSDLLRKSQAREQLKTTWTGSSGELPESLALKQCQEQAVNLINQFRQALESVTVEAFQTSLNSYQNQFEQEDFWQRKQYLIWFHGKDIQKQMQRQEPNYISLRHFYNWAINQLDINQHLELKELQTKIEQL